jgi:hypothetical protein
LAGKVCHLAAASHVPSYSPYTPYFCAWAFNLPRDSPEMAEAWLKIPSDVDVLITHGPPARILDMTVSNVNAGCAQLLARVQEIKPKLHVFGHIHEDYGLVKHGPTTFVNASICGLCYRPVNKPIVVELPMKISNQ